MTLTLLATEENEDDNDFGETRGADIFEVFAGDFTVKDDVEEEFTLRGVITFMVPGAIRTFSRSVPKWGFEGSGDNG